MDFITIVANDYDSALKQARSEYGSAVRVHTRKDCISGSLFGKKHTCEITFYLVEPTKEDMLSAAEERKKEEVPQDRDEKKAMSDFLPEMVAPSQGRKMLEDLLKANDFGDEYINSAEEKILLEDPLLPKKDFEMQILEYIIDNIEIDHASFSHPPKFFVLLGPTGVGKTTTLVKIAVLYNQIVPQDCQLKVAFLSLDSFRAGAYAQINAFCKDLHLDLYCCSGEEELSGILGKLADYDLVLVDTMGKSPKEGDLALKVKTMLSVLPKDDTVYYLAVSASHKLRDMERYLQMLGSYNLSGMVITKTDETENLGNILSFSKKHSLPLLFMTDGQKVPQDLHKVSNELILGFLQGFSLDFSTMGIPQSPSMQ